MATSTRIPRGIEDFDKWIVKSTPYLAVGTPVTNGERLGLLPAEITDWNAVLTEWTPLHVKYDDETNSRTRAVKNHLLLIIERMVDMDQTNHLLDRIAASANVTIEDLGIFNINGGEFPKLTRTVPTSRIVDVVYPTITALGGGSMSFKCYGKSSQRASIPDDADSVQILYQIGNTPPTLEEAENMKKEMSTKAIFTIDFGLNNSHKNLYSFLRWNSSKHPELAGPWSELQTNFIL